MTATTLAGAQPFSRDVTRTPSAPTRERVHAIDIIRGAVMVLMAIDHVRVYSGVPAGGPTPGVFFTRWVTHFCAPAFVFLAGTSAYLWGRRQQNRAALSRHLVIRGLWLVLLELTVLRVAWTFNFDFSHYLLAGVIWAIGWCMVLLAALVWLPTAAVGAIGLAIVVCHNAIDPFIPALEQTLSTSSSAWLWQLLYFGGPFRLGAHGPQLAVLYVIIPWIGVMAAGYAFGRVTEFDRARRNRVCYFAGTIAVAAFLVLRGFRLYGDPRPWTPDRPLSFIATNKYPASLLFLLMTLGPVLLLFPIVDTMRGKAASVLTVFGRVPFFYYVVHIPLIHLAAVVVSFLREGRVNPWLFANHPMMVPPPPPGYMWSLGLLYLVWAIVVVLLYFACRRFADVKARNRGGIIGLL